MKRIARKSGFTMVELLIALMITSIVLAAVATLAGAVAGANEVTDQMGREQSQLRQVSMRLADLIRRANCVLTTAEDGFWLWHDSDADGLATADELTQVVRGADKNTVMIGTGETHTACRAVSFGYDTAAPATQFINVSFEIAENGQLHKHSVSARLRGSDEHRKF